MPLPPPRIVPASDRHLQAIICLLHNDFLGATRESTNGNSAPYQQAFDEMKNDPNNNVYVAVLPGNGPDTERVVACFQLTFIPGLSLNGCTRAQIEAVRVHPDFRNKGLGRSLFDFAIARASARGCGLMQLTTNNARTGAHRFYEQLGFVSTHTGYKLVL